LSWQLAEISSQQRRSQSQCDLIAGVELYRQTNS